MSNDNFDYSLFPKGSQCPRCRGTGQVMGVTTDVVKFFAPHSPVQQDAALVTGVESKQCPVCKGAGKL